VPHYRRVGEVPPKRHTASRNADGTLVTEELVGEEGFSGPSSLVYHRRPPTQICAVEAIDAPYDEVLTPHRPVAPRHLLSRKLDPTGPTDAVTGRRLLLGNDDVRLSVVAADTPSPLFRDATGDQLVFVETGAGVLESTFGPLQVRGGDYVVIPGSVTHRWVPSPALRLLVLEASGHVEVPHRYLSKEGQHLEGAPYAERDLRGPEELPAEPAEGPVDVLVRHRQGWTRMTYATSPFDVLGWDGCAYPWALSVHDLEPLTGRIHQPPPVHQTFAGPGFVVCSFVPRRLDDHPLAVPAPYAHSNIDSDEVLCYVDGDFTSRKGAGIAAGSLTLHPAGLPHGPQPGAAEASIGAERTDELAVMLDTFRPLQLGEGALACADPAYLRSWLAPVR